MSNCTSDFRNKDVFSLNVEYSDAKSVDDMCIPCDMSDVPDEVYVSNLSKRAIVNALEDKHMFDKLDRKSKTFVLLMNHVMENEVTLRGTEESRTDAFVSHILEKLEFGEYPLMIQPQPLFKFRVYTKEISSKLDFAVIKDKRTMLIDEDKHIKNTGPASAWGEYQLAGELIASAYCNYSISTRDYNSILYGVRVIGLKFTFYKAVISPEYLISLGEGFPDLTVPIIRYPVNTKDKDFPYLDYADENDRKIIVNMLIRMRESIKS